MAWIVINLREQTGIVPATLKSQCIKACIIIQLCAGLCLHRLCARNRAHERQDLPAENRCMPFPKISRAQASAAPSLCPETKRMHLDDAALHSISHFGTMLASCKVNQVCLEHHAQRCPCNGVSSCCIYLEMFTWSLLLPCVLDYTPRMDTCQHYFPL